MKRKEKAKVNFKKITSSQRKRFFKKSIRQLKKTLPSLIKKLSR